MTNTAGLERTLRVGLIANPSSFPRAVKQDLKKHGVDIQYDYAQPQNLHQNSLYETLDIIQRQQLNVVLVSADGNATLIADLQRNVEEDVVVVDLQKALKEYPALAQGNFAGLILQLLEVPEKLPAETPEGERNYTRKEAWDMASSLDLREIETGAYFRGDLNEVDELRKKMKSEFLNEREAIHQFTMHLLKKKGFLTISPRGEGRKRPAFPSLILAIQSYDEQDVFRVEEQNTLAYRFEAVIQMCEPNQHQHLPHGWEKMKFTVHMYVDRDWQANVYIRTGLVKNG